MATADSTMLKGFMLKSRLSTSDENEAMKYAPVKYPMRMPGISPRDVRTIFSEAMSLAIRLWDRP
ncbi:MAG: hypothetical protein O6923_06900 [Actinobacteria bacterium]|nr:hypothetical protein [Actinomycetota bacterium]